MIDQLLIFVHHSSFYYFLSLSFASEYGFSRGLLSILKWEKHSLCGVA